MIEHHDPGNLQQQLEAARRRKAEAEAAEHQRLAEETRHQRAAAEATREAAQLQAQIAIHELQQQVDGLSAKAAQVEQRIEAITAALDNLRTALAEQATMQTVDVLTAIDDYRASRREYSQLYQQLHSAIHRAKSQHPHGNYQRLEVDFLMLKRPDRLRDDSDLVLGWRRQHTPHNPIGRMMTTPPVVDATVALVAILLDGAGYAGLRRYFGFK